MRRDLVDLLRWPHLPSPPWPQLAAAIFGLAGPIALGAALGNTGAGMAAAIGGLALSEGGQGDTLREQARSQGYSVIAGSLAVLLGATLARHQANFLLPGIAAAAALCGGISRPLAQATTRFILFTIIASGIVQPAPPPLPMALLFAAGAAWTASLSLLFWVLKRGKAAPVPARTPSLRAHLHHWRRSLRGWAGWQYTARITAALLGADLLGMVWSERRTHWALLTVAIVVLRQAPDALTRALERGLGTALGVGLAGPLLVWQPPTPLVVALVAVLAAARPILRPGNYTAYAAIMTPLIMRLMDLGRPPTWETLVDRLLATTAGCGMAVTLGYLVWRRLITRAAKQAPSLAMTE